MTLIDLANVGFAAALAKDSDENSRLLDDSVNRINADYRS